MKRASAVLAFLLSLLLPAQALACYGAAAMGMGGAYTSLAKGVLAIYWNQAGLAFTEGRGEASATITTPEDYINYNSFVGAAVRLEPRIGLGFGQTQLAPWAGDEVWNTVALGVKLSDRLAVGGAYRTVEGRDPDYGIPYDSAGVDFSAQYHAGQLNLGLLVQDVGGPNETDYYWQNIRPSISLETDKVTLGFDLYNAAELKYFLQNEPNDLEYQLGLELRPQGKAGPFALRAGIYHDVVTYGGGIKVKNFFADVVAMPEWEVVQFTGGIRF